MWRDFLIAAETSIPSDIDQKETVLGAIDHDASQDIPMIDACVKFSYFKL